MAGRAAGQCVSILGLDVQVTVVLALASAVVMGLCLSRLRAARRFFAVGSNPDAALMAGIDSARVVFGLRPVGGAGGAVRFLFLAKFGNITVVAGLGMEQVGGGGRGRRGLDPRRVGVDGGRGDRHGVGRPTIDNSLTRWELVSEFWRDALLGFLIMAAVTVDTFMSRQLGRLGKKEA